MPNDADIPALVFSGDYSEAIFLKTLLEAAGIEVSLLKSLGSRGGGPPQLRVRKRDAQAAHELIADFHKNGKRTTW